MLNEVKIIAHRGFGTDEFGFDGYIENTTEAFEKGFALPQVYACETDVRYTKDKVIICYHDPDIDSVPIDKYNFEEFKKLKDFVPKFEDIIKKFPEERFIIELKPGEDNKSIVKDIFENYISKDKNPDRFMFISFCIEYLLMVKEMRKETYCSWIITSFDIDYKRFRFLKFDPERYQLFLRKKDIDFCKENLIDEISGHYLSFTKSSVKYAKSLKIKIGLGPTNSLKFLSKAKYFQVDSIYTDKPEFIIKEINKLKD